jgi:tRNA(adenine34) deaminase
MLSDCDLFVTIEPCTMCYGAASLLHVRRIVYGAPSPKFGACGSIRSLSDDGASNHEPEIVAGLYANEITKVMQSYFRSKRPSPARSD